MSSPEPRRVTVLVYSSRAETRARVLSALGLRPAPGLELEFVEASTGAEVVAICDKGGVDLAVLDGEAAPTGGIGLGRHLPVRTLEHAAAEDLAALDAVEAGLELEVAVQRGRPPIPNRERAGHPARVLGLALVSRSSGSLNRARWAST